MQPDKPSDQLQQDFKLPLVPEPKNRKLLYVAIAILILAVLGVGGYFAYQLLTTATQPVVTSSAVTPSPSPKATVLELDTTKNYGDKYANGLLPVGDNKYSSDSAKKGSVYVCSTYAQNLKTGGGGADARGPWFSNDKTQYDLSKKVHVSGNVSWKGSFSNVLSGTTRTITTNDLPLSHPTGVYPIASTDPAYQYDRNPNSIKSQTLTYGLSASPTYGSPQCMGGEVGIMLTGVALFNGFDAGGRDAGAWEVQDSCGGHPQVSGEYHYHTLSSCIKDINVSTVIGFALDGFPITGPQVSAGNVLTTDDLDECHGITSKIMLDGKEVKSYHYVMTQDFPYSVSCFRAKAAQTPGTHEGGQLQTGAQPGMQQGPPPRP